MVAIGSNGGVSGWDSIFFVLVGALPDMRTGTYFSLTSYATVGYGDVLLPEEWRLLGSFEGTVGVLMPGWSTSLMVAVIATVYRQHFSGLLPQEARSPQESK
jgi:hypothetical protein